MLVRVPYSSPVHAFSWGYAGWGNSTRELVRAFDAVERERGFEPPVFVDVRARRQGRAKGFIDDAFERVLRRHRHRWMPGLGNDAVLTGRGSMRLVRPEDAAELLGLISAQHAQRRRVVFFCSCGSPFDAAGCHRQLVKRTLLAAARRWRAPLRVEEWPGGALKNRVAAELDVADTVIRALLRGASGVPLGTRPPSPALLSLPHGALVRLRSREREQLMSVTPPVFSGGAWKLRRFLWPVVEGDTAGELLTEAGRVRRELKLE